MKSVLGNRCWHIVSSLFITALLVLGGEESFPRHAESVVRAEADSFLACLPIARISNPFDTFPQGFTMETLTLDWRRNTH